MYLGQYKPNGINQNQMADTKMYRIHFCLSSHYSSTTKCIGFLFRQKAKCYFEKNEKISAASFLSWIWFGKNLRSKSHLPLLHCIRTRCLNFHGDKDSPTKIFCASVAVRTEITLFTNQSALLFVALSFGVTQKSVVSFF